MEAELGYAMWAVDEKPTCTFIGHGLRPAATMDPSAIPKSTSRITSPAPRGTRVRNRGRDRRAGARAHSGGTRGTDAGRASGERRLLAVMKKAGMRYEGGASYYGLEGLKKYTAKRDWWKPPASPGQGTTPAAG